MILYLILYYIAINLVAFSLMFSDKRRAVRNRWRIPEATLFLFAFLGGALGAFLGMYLFRHKTKHPKFTIGIPLLLLLHTVLFVFLCVRLPK